MTIIEFMKSWPALERLDFENNLRMTEVGMVNLVEALAEYTQINVEHYSNSRIIMPEEARFELVRFKKIFHIRKKQAELEEARAKRKAKQKEGTNDKDDDETKPEEKAT